MLEIKIKKTDDGSSLQTSVALEGSGEDLVAESYFAIAGLLKALDNESHLLKVTLVRVLAENPEWMTGKREIFDEEGTAPFEDGEELPKSLKDFLGKMAIKKGELS